MCQMYQLQHTLFHKFQVQIWSFNQGPVRESGLKVCTFHTKNDPQILCLSVTFSGVFLNKKIVFCAGNYTVSSLVPNFSSLFHRCFAIGTKRRISIDTQTSWNFHTYLFFPLVSNWTIVNRCATSTAQKQPHQRTAPHTLWKQRESLKRFLSCLLFPRLASATKTVTLFAQLYHIRGFIKTGVSKKLMPHQVTTADAGGMTRLRNWQFPSTGKISIEKGILFWFTGSLEASLPFLHFAIQLNLFFIHICTRQILQFYTMKISQLYKLREIDHRKTEREPDWNRSTNVTPISTSKPHKYDDLTGIRNILAWNLKQKLCSYCNVTKTSTTDAHHYWHISQDESS